MTTAAHFTGTTATALLITCAAASAADRTVDLILPPPVHKNLAAMPQIAQPADAAETRINTATRRLDVGVGKAAHDCKGSDGKPGHWERSVQVPMRGPGYISFVIVDDIFCDGPYPDVGTMAIVYDLRSGAPVDWTQLLPPALTGKPALEEGADGTKMVTLKSKRLFDLYLAAYRSGDGEADAPAECRQAIQDFTTDGPPAMMAWLDSKGPGLALRFSLPHVAQVCEQAVIIPIAALRAEGAKSALLDAFGPAR